MRSESVCNYLARLSYFLGVSLGNQNAWLSPSKRAGDYHYKRKQGDEGAMRFHNLLLIQTDLYFYATWLSSKGYAMGKKGKSGLGCLTHERKLCNMEQEIIEF